MSSTSVVIAVLVVILLAGGIWLANGAREEVPQIGFYDVGIRDVGTVFSQLQGTGSNASYGLFVFFPRCDASEDSHVELQFSIEDGVVGFDWVLLGDLKLADADRFVEHAESRGHSVERHERNNVQYFRVEDGDLVGLCVSIMESFYGLKPNMRFELVARRFYPGRLPPSTQKFGLG